jgi:hypothetical protein
VLLTHCSSEEWLFARSASARYLCLFDDTSVGPSAGSLNSATPIKFSSQSFGLAVFRTAFVSRVGLDGDWIGDR